MILDLQYNGIGRMVKIFFTMAFLMIMHFQVYGQCENKISLGKIATVGENLRNGKIDLIISTKSSYEAQLYFFDGTSIQHVGKSTGRGSGTLTFDGLSAIENYEVLVIFNDEVEVLCKKRKISGISTTIK